MNGGIKILYVFVIAASTIVSCKKKEEDAKTTSASYKDQDLQGIINDIPWEYVAGYVHTTGDFTDSTKFTHYFSILDTTHDDTCLAFSEYGSYIEFSFLDANALLTNGSHTLKFDPVDLDKSKLLFFLYHEAGDPVTEVVEARKGNYEILSVDTTSQIVTGRINVKYDEHHSVNGNFTLKYCNW